METKIVFGGGVEVKVESKDVTLHPEYRAKKVDVAIIRTDADPARFARPLPLRPGDPPPNLPLRRSATHRFSRRIPR